MVLLYLITFQWFLKLVIFCRQNSIKEALVERINSAVGEDEEMAEAMVDSDNEDDIVNDEEIAKTKNKMKLRSLKT